VRGEQQPVAGLAADHGEPQQRRPGQVERGLPVPQGDLVGVAVEYRDGRRHLSADELQRPGVTDEAGPQRRMPPQQCRERRLQSGDINQTV
jgi:hypothetical protein